MSTLDIATGLANVLTLLLATNTPVLPHAGVVSLWLPLAWGLVLAWCVHAVVRRVMVGSRRVDSTPSRLLEPGYLCAGGAFIWAWVPGEWGPVHWLGLAFQSPSVASVLCCLLLLLKPMAPTTTEQHGAWFLPMCGVLLGWVLLLDTFALLPGQWYALGFSPAAVLTVAGVACVPWLFGGATLSRACVLPVVVVTFVALRLPTGNVWDAVLDPWLWLALHGVLLRRILKPKTTT